MSSAPPANEALARPPSIGMWGLVRSSAASSSSAGKLNGSQSTSRDSSAAGFSSTASARDSGSPSSRKPSASRSAVTCIVSSSAPGRDAPQTTTPGVSSSSRPPARVPPAPQPISALGSSRSWTSESSHFAMPRCWPDANTTARSHGGSRPARARPAASAAASTVSKLSDAPTEARTVACRETGTSELAVGRGREVEVLPDEGIDVAVQHAVRVPDLVVRPVVLHPLVRVQEVAADLRAPFGRLLLAALLGELLRLLQLLALQQAGTQDLHRGRPVLDLRALVLGLGDQPGG